MKLKPVVATMCVLGLGAAGTAFAAGGVDAQIANLQAQIQQLQAQVNHMGTTGGHSAAMGSSLAGMVSTNSTLSQQLNGDKMLVGQDLMILNDAKAGKIAHGLTIGGMLQGDMSYAHSNKRVTGDVNESLFNNLYLDGRNSTAKSQTAVTLTNFKLNMLANLNAWTNAVVQLGESYPGQDLTEGLKGSNFLAINSGIQVQQAYLLIGNLAQSPFYGFVGNRYIDFGQFANVNPFTQPLTREFFQAAGDTVGAGIHTNGIDATLSLMNGGNSNNMVYATNGVVAQNLYTRNNSEINNFAINLGYGQDVNNVDWHVGLGYLNGGSKANARVGKSGQTGDLRTNSVWDANARLSVANFDFYAEYMMSGSASAKADGVNGDGDISSYAKGGHAQAWQLAGDYNFPLMGHKSVASLSYSQAKAVNATDATFAQYVAGLRTEAMKNVWAGVEYAYQDGVPVNYVNNGTLKNGDNVTNNTVTLDLTAYF